jgi:hypothetical protein
MASLAEKLRWLAGADLLYARLDRLALNTIKAVCQATDFDAMAIILVRWAIQGQLYGNEWLVCDSCQQPRLTEAKKGVACKMVPGGDDGNHGCGGHMIRIAKRPFTSPKLRQALRSEANGLAR